MSDNDKLINRCFDSYEDASGLHASWSGIEAVLRESGHAELVAALKEAISELNDWCKTGWGEGYNNLRFNAALLKAGAR